MAHFCRAVRISSPTLVALCVVLLQVTVSAQQTSSTPTPQSSGGRAAGTAVDQFRAFMKRVQDMHAQELAAEIGPPPADCQVDVGYSEDDEGGEGAAQFIADVFHRAYWHVVAYPSEALSCAVPGILIQCDPSTATVAEKLRAALLQREETVIAPAWLGDPRGCGLHITIGPQWDPADGSDM